jgi:P2 family phage major capsid protein
MSKSVTLSPSAVQKMALLYAITAKRYGVPSVEQFTATPSLAQALNLKIVEDGDPFLRLISIVPVAETQAEKLGLYLSGRVSGRTDTSGSGERTPKHLVAVDNEPYTLSKTDSDVALKYQKIDVWAKFPNFHMLYRQAVGQAIGNDRLTVGWHGTSIAATTNIVANPLLQDVNEGWLHKIRNWNSAAQYIVGTSGAPIELGGADFPNLDTLVHHARQLLPVYHRNRPDLVALVSNDLMFAQEDVYYAENGSKPTEKILVNQGIIQKAYGGLPSMTPPFFPDGTVLVTPLKNLAIYWQDSSWRRQMIDNPKRDQYEDFNTRNEGYVVEDYEMTGLVENVTVV